MINLEIENVFLKEVDSTQTFVKKHAQEFNQNKITCVVADTQTSGYGRHQRKWLSPSSFENIYCSFYFVLPSSIKNFVNISELLSYSLIEFLIENGLKPEIKWPNDVLLSQKKLAGILCETSFQNETVQIFLGIGLNVNLPKKECSQVDQPATSLLIETEKKWQRDFVLEKVQKQFLKNLSLFLKEGFASFAAKIDHLLAHKNKSLTFYDGDKEYTGSIVSISSDGALNFKIEKTAEIKKFYSGTLITTKKNK